MKNLKNILSLSIIALCTFCLMGIMEVKAAVSASSFDIVCDPQSIEKGQQSKCFLLAKINEDGGVGVDGFVTKVETEGTRKTKNLKIDEVKPAPIRGDEVGAAHLQSGQTGTEGNTTGFECTNTNSAYPGCYIFYGKNGNTFKKVTSFADNGIGLSGYDGFTVVGYYEVSLTENASMTDCGELCVEVAYAADAAGWGSLAGNQTQVCEEVKPTGNPDSPTTGSFTSYIVLIGGAFLAIGAIAIARKNNKFFRV